MASKKESTEKKQLTNEEIMLFNKDKPKEKPKTNAAVNSKPINKETKVNAPVNPPKKDK